MTIALEAIAEIRRLAQEWLATPCEIIAVSGGLEAVNAFRRIKQLCDEIELIEKQSADFQRNILSASLDDKVSKSMKGFATALEHSKPVGNDEHEVLVQLNTPMNQ